MTAEKFSQIASGVQSIAVVIGLVVGGVWAFLTLVVQNPLIDWSATVGGETFGDDRMNSKAELSLEKLDPLKRQYEITLTLTNTSKSLYQSITFEDEHTKSLIETGSRTHRGRYLEIIYFLLGQTRRQVASFSSQLSPETTIFVPPLESRQVRFLAEFPSDGVYIVETNFCPFEGKECLVQKYVSVAGASIEPTAGANPVVKRK